MRALAGGVLRVSADGRSAEQRRFSAHCRAYAERCGGTVPADARTLLRECWRVMLDLDRLNGDLDAAVARRRRRDERRIRRQLTIMRSQLFAFERRLDELAQQRTQGWAVPRG